MHNQLLIFTYEPFYGKSRNLHIFNTNGKKNKDEFHFITCSLINQGKQIPLMALPVRIGEQTKLVIDLVKYCQFLFPRIRSCLFDSGFYIAELIDFLESSDTKYLIFVPKRPGILKDYLNQTEKFGRFTHQLGYTKDKKQMET